PIWRFARWRHMIRGYGAWLHLRRARDSRKLHAIGLPRYPRRIWRRHILRLHQRFTPHTIFGKHEPRDVATRPRQAIDVARADRIAGDREHDWHGAGRL